MNSSPRRFDWQAIKQRLAERVAGSDYDTAEGQSRIENVYHARMLDYANRQSCQADRSSRRQVVVCSIGSRDFGIEVARVVKVLPLSQCMSVPGAPKEVIGIVNVAGEIYSVVDAAVLVGATLSGDDKRADEGHAVLLRGTKLKVALKVESVKAIENIDIAALASPERTRAESNREFAAGSIAGVTPEGLIVLDMEQLMSHPIFSPETVCK